jgi:hypothetical protein
LRFDQHYYGAQVSIPTPQHAVIPPIRTNTESQSFIWQLLASIACRARLHEHELLLRCFFLGCGLTCAFSPARHHSHHPTCPSPLLRYSTILPTKRTGRSANQGEPLSSLASLFSISVLVYRLCFCSEGHC